MHKRLYIPGPIEVRREILEACSLPMIGHRSQSFKELHHQTTSKLQKLLFTKNHVFLSTSSATGLWEASIRNCVMKKCLHLVNGAFSNKWHQVSLANGKDADKYEVEWGSPITADEVRRLLEEEEYDTVALVHNETSTGVESPLDKIAEVISCYDNVLFLVDAVSSMGGVEIQIDRLGIDVCIASVQKAFGLPPGLALASVSEKALSRSRSMKNKGYYFDFEVFLKYHQKDNTISTPPIPQIYALDRQLDAMFNEGLDGRFSRHEKLQSIMHEWVRKNGFGFFAEEGFRSKTMTCIKNTKNISIAELNRKLAERNFVIANGYGPLKEKTFRISHMGDTRPEQLQELLMTIEEVL